MSASDRLHLCRVEPLRQALRRLGTTPKHLQDYTKPRLVAWVRQNCDVEEVTTLAIQIGGEINPIHPARRRKNGRETGST